METFSALLAICAGNSPVPGEFPAHRPVTLICVWINSWVNNRKAGDLRRHRTHYGVIVLCCLFFTPRLLGLIYAYPFSYKWQIKCHIGLTWLSINKGIHISNGAQGSISQTTKWSYSTANLYKFGGFFSIFFQFWRSNRITILSVYYHNWFAVNIIWKTIHLSMKNCFGKIRIYSGKVRVSSPAHTSNLWLFTKNSFYSPPNLRHIRTYLMLRVLLRPPLTVKYQTRTTIA